MTDEHGQILEAVSRAFHTADLAAELLVNTGLPRQDVSTFHAIQPPSHYWRALFALIETGLVPGFTVEGLAATAAELLLAKGANLEQTSPALDRYAPEVPRRGE